MIKAVIFDFNGVLVDDEDVHFRLFQEVLAEDQIHITERDYHERYLGYDDRGCFAAVLTDNGRSFDTRKLDQMIAEKARRYIRAADLGLRFFPCAAETLRAMASRGPVGICSGALRAEIVYALKRLECSDCVSVIVAAEDVDQCKPHPAGYLEALRLLQSQRPGTDGTGLEAVNCLVVEDSLAGIISAKAAGMRVAGITHTYTGQQLRESGADLVVNSLGELTPEWIQRPFSASRS